MFLGLKEVSVGMTNADLNNEIQNVKKEIASLKN